MEIIIAQESHLPEIIGLWDEFARFHEPFDPRYPMRDDIRSGYEVYLRKTMEEKDTRVMVAQDNGKTVGFVMAMIRKYPPVWQRERHGFIEEIAVAADYRRKGTGSRLLKKIMDWFESENIDMIELTVASKNKVGYSFWKKHGFQDYLHHLYLKP
jgi:ribosomal protein S18 acetylase RimI-like enzyme